MNPYTAILIISIFLFVCISIAFIEEAIKYFRPKKEIASVKFKPAIMKTVHPDKQLSFNKWTEYIRKECDKSKKQLR